MKNIFRYAALLLAVSGSFLFASCEGEENPAEKEEIEISLEVTSEEVTFTYEGGTEYITIATDADQWDYLVAASWLTVEKWDDGIVVNAPQYSDKEKTRVGNIIVYAYTGNNRSEIKIKVTQTPAGNSAVTPAGMIAFECEEFKTLALEACDRNGDGEVSPAEAAYVTDLVLTYDEENTEINKITSLKGIEYFVNLVNLDCDLNALTSLDLSGLKKLKYVDCAYNYITSLNVSGCESLQQLYFYSNNVSDLNIDGCVSLQLLQGYKNNIKRVDVSNLSELGYFDLRFNALTDIKVSNCPELKVIAVGDNNIASIELTGLPELYTLGCYNNSFTSLDLSNLPKLEMLECYNNNLVSLDLSANPKLTTLTCQNNMISDLNISSCTLMSKFDCSSNRLSGVLDMSAYKNLKTFICGGNKFTSINIDGCTLITDLSCENTDITSINVSDAVNLESFVCNDCLLATLDVSANGKLKKLYAQGNPLTSVIMAQGQVINDLKLDNHDVISYK